MIRRHKPRQQEADLDITSFMNLMIILVPVLLMSMVFSHITVLDLKLPDLAADSSNPDTPPKQLELIIREDFFDVSFPAGHRLKRIEKTSEGELDYDMLSLVLQEVKRSLKEQEIEKRDILVLSETNTSYQTIVKVMDTVRSFKAVVAASVVDAELFPEVSLGDAPVLEVAP